MAVVRQSAASAHTNTRTRQHTHTHTPTHTLDLHAIFQHPRAKTVAVKRWGNICEQPTVRLTEQPLELLVRVKNCFARHCKCYRLCVGIQYQDGGYSALPLILQGSWICEIHPARLQGMRLWPNTQVLNQPASNHQECRRCYSISNIITGKYIFIERRAQNGTDDFSRWKTCFSYLPTDLVRV